MPPDTTNSVLQRRSLLSRLRPRFSLRTMLAVLTIVCILIPTWILPSERQRRAAEQIDSINGFWAFSSENIVKIRNNPASRSWFEHFYRRVDCISFNTDALTAATTDQPNIDWKWLPHLKRFELAGSPFWGSDKTHPDSTCRTTLILSQLANNQEFEEIDLADAVVDSEGIEALVQMQKLLSLRARGSLLDDEDLIELSKLTKLKTLEVTLRLFSPATIFKDSGIPQLTDLKSTVTADGIAALATLPQLDSLKLNIAGTDSPEIFAPLENFRSLKKLEMNYYEAKDAILAPIGKIPNLEELTFSNPSITDEGLPYLKDLKHLKKLNLGSPKITGSGFKELANLQKLEVLQFKACEKLEPKYLPDLLRLQSLRKVWVDSPLCSKADMEPLRELPKLQKIIFDYIVLNEVGTKCCMTMVINKDGTSRDFRLTDIFD